MRTDAAASAQQFKILSRSQTQDFNAPRPQLRLTPTQPDGANNPFGQFVIRARSDVNALSASLANAQESLQTAHIAHPDRKTLPPAPPRNQSNEAPPVLDPQAQDIPAPGPATTQPILWGQLQLDAVQQHYGTSVGDRDFAAAADANGDGSINFSDITYILGKWGQPAPDRVTNAPFPTLSGPFGQAHIDAAQRSFGAAQGDSNYSQSADANADGKINFSDITYILGHWGEPPAASTP